MQSYDDVTTFGDLHRTADKVYRLTTQSSTYLLGMYSRGVPRSVVVRGEVGSDKAHVIVRDSNPLIGGRSLWSVAPVDWVGHALEVGTMTTSRIRSVTEITDEQTVRLFAGRVPAAAGSSEEQTGFKAPREVVRYPESHVRYAEGAASRLRTVADASSLFADVADDALLEDRLRVALAGCAVALQSIRGNVRERKGP